jgi:hypothetical protein
MEDYAFCPWKLRTINIQLSEYSKKKDWYLCCSITYMIPNCYHNIYFIYFLDNILNQIYSNSNDIILWGDINVDYLNDNHTKLFLDSLLASYSVHGTVQFSMFLLSWKYHIAEFKTKLSKARYAIRSIKLFMSLEVIIITYFSYVYSFLSYGIVFWGNSS